MNFKWRYVMTSLFLIASLSCTKSIPYNFLPSVTDDLFSPGFYSQSKRFVSQQCICYKISCLQDLLFLLQLDRLTTGHSRLCPDIGPLFRYTYTLFELYKKALNKDISIYKERVRQ